MADTSHLERMGRELKCPICLSLLNSAVSLSCNHVFCYSCIEKSMKAASNCPVCKVPFRRREIRPAPHMDNLVSVYKSMEVASGFNIFVTQNADSTKLSGDQAGVNNCEAKDDAIQAGNNKRRRKGSRGALKTNKSPTDSNTTKPSFPTKKRVQLPQYPNPETQMDPEKREGGIVEVDRKGPEEMSGMVKNGEPVFSPFFWLRDEEDMGKSTQQTDDNQVLYTPPDAPCFSDIKDSDDEDAGKRSSDRGTCFLSTSAKFIDSEMFDWTQRPCSPELCSSPLAIQNDYTADQEVQKKPETKLTETTTGSKKCPKNKKACKRMADEASGANSGRRASKNNKSRKGKRAKKTMSDVSVPPVESDMVTPQGNEESKEGNPLILREKPQDNEKISTEANFEEKCVPNLLQVTEPLANGNETAPLHVSPSVNPQKSSGGSRNSQSSDKRRNKAKKAVVQPKKIGPAKSNTSKVHIYTEQHNEAVNSSSKINFFPLSYDNDLSNRFVKRTNEENSKKMSSSLKKVEFSLEDKCGSTPLTANVDGAMKGQTPEEIQGATNQNRIKVLTRKDKVANSLDGIVLAKCSTSPSTIRCAFCQASEESEATGIMVRYVNGKLVDENHDSRINATHVHKNCTEWAPNVYFEDDTVINLEAELSRSRRITCSCCGIKGAALGCYERSCRKSFHVSCARLTPECRWDFENFVMLCPIHASCQLPNEMPQSQSRQKRNSAVKRKPVVQVQAKSTDVRNQDSTLQWKSQKRLKHLILCCSALTAAEKEIVTEFEKLSGASILKNWDVSVTHVIASTDENGACRRTLKFLMGVLEGKWILSVQWLKACMAAGELVDEQHYEISVDIHGIKDGPRLGRLRHLNKQPKLFEGCMIHFLGDFEPSYKRFLHNLVIAGGGKVLNRKPVAEDQTNASNKPPGATVFVIYSLELPDQCCPSDGSFTLKQRCAQAEVLASSTGAVVATNSWILNSISGCRLQEIGE